MNITFPDNPDTFALDLMRLSGNTLPGARVFVNDDPVKVYWHGAFVTRVVLEDGENLIRIRANKDTLQTVKEIIILRPPKLVESDTVETVIDTLYQVPAEKIMVLPGDFVRVRFKGSPGGSAYFSIDKIADEIPMVELPPEESMGLRGIYSGILQVHDGPRNRPLKIECELKGLDDKKKKITLSGKLFIMSDDVPVVAETREEAWLQNYTNGFVPITLMQEKTQLHIIGKTGKRFKVKLAPSTVGYVDEDKVEFLEWGKDLPIADISAPVLYSNESNIKLRFPSNRNIPAVISADLSIPEIRITWYGAQQVSHWITFPNEGVDIEKVTFEHSEESVLKAIITPTVRDIWGYRLYFDESGYHVNLLKSPVQTDTVDSCFLKGVTIALDPGHGGEYDGAASPSGFLEKEINLQWAKLLADSLEKYGASIVLTRDSDITLPLKDRVDIARKHNAHILLSLHNNSTTPGGNAVRTRGTSVYFFHPHSKALAWAIYPHLVDLGLAPYGRIHNSYYVTRVTDMVTLLLEGAFLSHPEEELKFSKPVFLQQLSNAVVEGLRDYMKNQTTDQ